MEKMVIIALDGLEPSLVTEKMSNLLQIEYGITEVNVTPLQTHHCLLASLIISD